MDPFCEFRYMIDLFDDLGELAGYRHLAVFIERCVARGAVAYAAPAQPLLALKRGLSSHRPCRDDHRFCVEAPRIGEHLLRIGFKINAHYLVFYNFGAEGFRLLTEHGEQVPTAERRGHARIIFDLVRRAESPRARVFVDNDRTQPGPGGVHGRTQSGRPSADDDHIVNPRCLFIRQNGFFRHLIFPSILLWEGTIATVPYGASPFLQDTFQAG